MMRCEEMGRTSKDGRTSRSLSFGLLVGSKIYYIVDSIFVFSLKLSCREISRTQDEPFHGSLPRAERNSLDLHFGCRNAFAIILLLTKESHELQLLRLHFRLHVFLANSSVFYLFNFVDRFFVSP